MDITIKKELNRNFEILGLLYICSHPEYIGKEYYLDAAKEYNLDGEKMYNKFSAVWVKYIKAFQKEMYLPQDALFFFEEDDGEQDVGFLLLMHSIFADKPHWAEDISTATDNELRLALLQAAFAETLPSTAPTLEEGIKLLKTWGVPPAVCWKITLVLQNPKEYFGRLAEIIRKNFAAYKSALAAVEKPLEKLLCGYADFECKISSTIKKGAVITPVLIFPGAEIMDGFGNAYFGLYLRDIYKMIEDTKTAHTALLPTLKALGDQSKFDIMLLLKKAPMYNLELAENLGLTAATVSHHMNVLLSHGLVTVEKYDGKVYYSIKADTFEEIISQLKSIFL